MDVRALWRKRRSAAIWACWRRSSATPGSGQTTRPALWLTDGVELRRSHRDGNPDEIALRRDELQSVLQARESLPGVSWTADQSINFLLDAGGRRARIIEGRNERATQRLERQPETDREAAENG